MVDPCSFTVPAIAGSISGVIVVAAGIVVIVIIVFLQYCKFKKRACHQYKELHLKELKEENEQEETKAARHEYHYQWSREKVERFLDDLREMRKILCATNDKELFQEFMAEYMKMTREAYGQYLSSVAPDSKERNVEVEREQKEQILNLLREILKGGKRNESLKPEMLSTIMDEVGSEVTDWKSQSTHLESTNIISGQQPPMEAREEAGGKGNYSG